MKRAIAFSTLILMLFTTLLYPIAAQEQMNEAQRAEEDARREVSQDISTISWGIGGFFCSVFAVGYAYITKPPVPAARFVGKSADYITFYTETYQKEGRKQRGQAAMIGCLANSIFSTITYYFFYQSQQ